MELKKILLSRTDAIGDLILTLPMIDVIKQNLPTAKVFILGRNYNKPISDASLLADGFINWSELEQKPNEEIIKEFQQQNFDAIIHVFPNKKIAKIAKTAKIPIRIGTSHRYYHWFSCNYKINLSRRKSSLHESQLNIKLLEKLNIVNEYTIENINNLGKIRPVAILPDEINTLLQNNSNPKAILHIKSKNSARNWEVNNFVKLAEMLYKNNYSVFITGSKEENEIIKKELGYEIPNTYNLMGKFQLEELIKFISCCDVLVAASTGPLHIAAALGIHAVGIYPPIKPMHPDRWKPIGVNVDVLCVNKDCEVCRRTNKCLCMQQITPEQVLDVILKTSERTGTML